MTLLIISAAIIGVGAAILVGARYHQTVNAARNEVTEAYIAATESDFFDELERSLHEAQKVWPYLWREPTAWAGLAGIVATVGMNFNFAQIMGYSFFLGLIIWALFSMFDVAVPFAAISTDTDPVGTWYESPPKKSFWVITAVSVCASIVVGITSLSAIGTRADNVNRAKQQKVDILRKNIASYSEQIREIEARIGGGSVTKFRKLAEEWDEKADREAARGYCGTKCEAIKSQAAVYHANAADAEQRDTLYLKRKRALLELDGLSATQTNINGFSRAIGTIAGVRDTQSVLLFTLVGLVVLFMIAHPFLWLIAADNANRARYFALQAQQRHVFRKAIERRGGERFLRTLFPPETLAKLTGEDVATAQKTGTPSVPAKITETSAGDTLSPSSEPDAPSPVLQQAAAPKIDEAAIAEKVAAVVAPKIAQAESESRELAQVVKALAEKVAGQEGGESRVTNLTITSNDALRLDNDAQYLALRDYIDTMTVVDPEGSVTVNDLWVLYRNSTGENGLARPVFEQKLALLAHSRDGLTLDGDVVRGVRLDVKSGG